MNDCSISSELHIHICKGGSTFTKLFVSLQDSTFLKYDRKISYALSTDASIHIRIKKITVLSPLHHMYNNRM